MDQAHPIAKFLLRYGYWIRGVACGLTLCLMLHTGFLSFGEPQGVEPSNMLYLGLMLLGTFAPSVGQWPISRLWEKITPVKDRVTYAEDEIVFIGSAILGISGTLFFWVLIPPLSAIKISLWVLMAISPVLFLIWFLKSTFAPLDMLDTTADVKAAQDFRRETPNFWANLMAYFIAALVSALVITLTIVTVSMSRGGAIDFGTGCVSVVSMVITNLIAAPIFIWIGGKFIPSKKDAKGLFYTLGGTVFATVIFVVNLPKILQVSSGIDSPIEPQAIINAWPFVAAYLLIILSYMAGGLTLSKLYKPRPAALEFG